VPFDLGRLEVVGTPAPVLEGVVTTLLPAADIAVSTNGSLVYVPGGPAGAGQRAVVAVDRQGRTTALPGLPLDAYQTVKVSPDGARLALSTEDDVWIYDFARANRSRLTNHPAQDTKPLWTPDGQRIIFTSMRAGYPELFWRPADGTGSDERLLTRGKELLDLFATGWSADGKQLLFSEVSPGLSPGIQCAIGQVPIERPADATVLLKNNSCTVAATVSPNGKWIAYASVPSGRLEVYVERYPELGNRQSISPSGFAPLWSPDGSELLFSSPDNRQMLAVAVQSGTTLVAGRPQVLFDIAAPMGIGGSGFYDVGPDGRFLIIRSGQEGDAGTATNLIFVQHWLEELKRLVPAN
jgi:eukaryotic-like serine/threonine-protein kinase